MSSTNEPWFVAERSEALAGVLLTSREDVRVRTERKRDGGLDFLVEIDTGELLSTQLFVVQVKGAKSSDPGEWMPDVEPLFRGSGRTISLPVCVFVVDVRENRAFYAWVAEPRVEAKGATLRIHETGTFHPLDPAVVGEIVDRVKAWYQALPKQLMPACGAGKAPGPPTGSGDTGSAIGTYRDLTVLDAGGKTPGHSGTPRRGEVRRRGATASASSRRRRRSPWTSPAMPSNAGKSGTMPSASSTRPSAVVRSTRPCARPSRRCDRRCLRRRG